MPLVNKPGRPNAVRATRRRDLAESKAYAESKPWVMDITPRDGPDPEVERYATIDEALEVAAATLTAGYYIFREGQKTILIHVSNIRFITVEKRDINA